MGKGFDEILTIVSDVAAFIPGMQWAPLAADAVVATDEMAHHKSPLGAVLSAVGNVAGQGLGSVLGNVGGNIAGGVGKEIGQVAGQVAGDVGAPKLLEPGLARMLGVNNTPPPTPSANLAPTKMGQSSGASAGGAPGGLNISGSTAPNIGPWATGGASQPSGSPLAQSQQKGI